jgi:hypothetical protein
MTSTRLRLVQRNQELVAPALTARLSATSLVAFATAAGSTLARVSAMPPVSSKNSEGAGRPESVPATIFRRENCSCSQNTCKGKHLLLLYAMVVWKKNQNFVFVFYFTFFVLHRPSKVLRSLDKTSWCIGHGKGPSTWRAVFSRTLKI